MENCNLNCIAVVNIPSVCLNVVVLDCAALVCYEMQWKSRPYCSRPQRNPWYLVCSLGLLRWKVEPGVDLLLKEGLALKSDAGQRCREDILQFLLLSSATLPSHAETISICDKTLYIFPPFYLSGFVCLFSLHDESLVSPCHSAVNHNYIASRCKELETERWRKRQQGVLCLSL